MPKHRRRQNCFVVHIGGLLSWLLRHNDIHYARACQAFSIEWKYDSKSINFPLLTDSLCFFLLLFGQNVYKWRRDWRGKRQAATFSFHSNISHKKYIYLKMTPKSRFIYSHKRAHCSQSAEKERERFISSSSNIVCHTKVKWSGFIDHHFHHIDMIRFENWNTLNL